MRRGAVCRNVNHRPPCLVVIDDLDRLRPFGRPGETDTELRVDPDTVLPASIALERFQLIARWHAKRRERYRCIELIQLPARDGPERARTDSSCRTGIDAVEDILGAGTGERANHGTRTANRMP